MWFFSYAGVSGTLLRKDLETNFPEIDDVQYKL
jgi:hypothetical protein